MRLHSTQRIWWKFPAILILALLIFLLLGGCEAIQNALEGDESEEALYREREERAEIFGHEGGA